MNPGDIKRDTKLYGVVGNALEKSLFPSLVNNFFDFNGINAFCSIFNIRDEDLPFFLSNIKSRAIEGIFIQKSHAGMVCAMADEVSQSAKSAGVVDTVFIKESKLIGAVSRASALAKTLDEKSMLKDKRVAICGTDGWAKAAVLEIVKYEPAVIAIIGEYPEESLKFAEDIRSICGFSLFEYERIKIDISKNDVLLNFSSKCKNIDILNQDKSIIIYDDEGSLKEPAKRYCFDYFDDLYIAQLGLKEAIDSSLGIRAKIDKNFMDSLKSPEIF